MAIYRAPLQPRGDDQPARAHNEESTSNSAPDLSTMSLRDVAPVILETRRVEQILKLVELSLTAGKRKKSIRTSLEDVTLTDRRESPFQTDEPIVMRHAGHC